MGQTAPPLLPFFFSASPLLSSGSLSLPLYICFHDTLQIAGFNNVLLEALLYAFGASIIEAQCWCSLLIMGGFGLFISVGQFFHGNVVTVEGICPGCHRTCSSS